MTSAEAFAGISKWLSCSLDFTLVWLKQVDYSIKMSKNPYNNLTLISGCEHVPLYQIIIKRHIPPSGLPGFQLLPVLTITTWDEYLRGSRWSRGRQGRRESDSAALLADLLESLWCRDWILTRAFFLRGFGLMGAGLARVAGGTCCGVMGVKEQARWEYKGKKTEVR